MSNVFSCTGNVGRDAEQRYLPSGQAVLNVTVGTSVGFGDKQQTIWLRCAVWGKRAEGQLVNFLKKGQQVFVSGELSQSEYQAKDGTTKTMLELNCNIIDLVGKKNDNQQAPQAVSQSAPPASKPPAQQRPAQQAQQPPRDNFDDFDDFNDSIPF